jgi:hypothetical protein
MNQDFCFSILALKPKYQLLAKGFAEDLEKHCPEMPIVVGTDNPDVFRACRNVSAFKLEKRGILHCYHDKRFVMEKALEKFQVVIQIDADTRITGSLPNLTNLQPCLAAVHIERALHNGGMNQ